MELQILRIPIGIVNCYLVRQEGCVLLDCAGSGQAAALCRALEALSVQPQQVGLIIATHGHFDHVGSAAEMARRTGAKVAIHREDKWCLEQGRTARGHPRTTRAQLMFLAARFLDKQTRFPPLTPDLIIEDEGLSLEDYGIPGKIIFTPGHTAGSISVLLPEGRALIGDLAMNGLPSLSRRPGLPTIVSDVKTLAASWRILFNAGVKTVYPGHGKPFPAEVMRPLIASI